jgi:hypothetical protein
MNGVPTDDTAVERISGPAIVRASRQRCRGRRGVRARVTARASA